MFDRHEVIYVAIVCADDSVEVMQFITRAWSSKEHLLAGIAEEFNIPNDLVRPEKFSREATPKNIDAEIAKTAFAPEKLPIKSWSIVELEALPTDRKFRDAWRATEDAVIVDMDKARDIQRDRIRVAREPLMAALDVEQKRALVAEDKVKVAEIEAKLQALRDAPADPRIDAAQTPEELDLIKIVDVSK